MNDGILPQGIHSPVHQGGSNYSYGFSSRIVQSIYIFDPSQIATESFSSPFISETYTNQHIKSLEKSKKGKIQNFYCFNIAPRVQHENEAAYSILLYIIFFNQNFTIIQSSMSKRKRKINKTIC